MWSGTREYLLGEVFYFTRECAAAGDAYALGNATVRSLALIDEARWVHDGLLFGNVSMGTPGLARLSGQSSILFGDACNYISAPGCETFAGGIMTKGLDVALRAFLDTCESMVLSLSTVPRPMAAADTYDALNSDEMVFVRDLLFHYLSAATIASTTNLADSATQNVQSFQKNSEIAAIVVNVIMFVVFAVFYLPLSRAIDKQIKNSRMLLMLIPTELLENHGSIRHYFQHEL
eukprot:Opistho-2@92470